MSCINMKRNIEIYKVEGQGRAGIEPRWINPWKNAGLTPNKTPHGTTVRISEGILGKIAGKPAAIVARIPKGRPELLEESNEEFLEESLDIIPKEFLKKPPEKLLAKSQDDCLG